MEKVKIISHSRKGFAEIVVRKPNGHRKDGTQKYSSVTYHVPKYRIFEFKGNKK